MIVRPLLAVAVVAALLVAGNAWTALPIPQVVSAVADEQTEIGTPMERIVKEAIAALGPLMLLGWYLYHTQTKTLPEKDKQVITAISAFQAAVTQLIVAHAEVVKSVMGEHKASNERDNAMILEIVRKCPGPTKIEH